MKRSRQASYGWRYREDEAASAEKAKSTEPEKSWSEYMEGVADDKLIPYAISAKFDHGALLAHPTFGKGIVVHVDGRRLDVLFESGRKKLAHSG